jgi:hypothetical protein
MQEVRPEVKLQSRIWNRLHMAIQATSETWAKQTHHSETQDKEKCSGLSIFINRFWHDGGYPVMQ